MILPSTAIQPFFEWIVVETSLIPINSIGANLLDLINFVAKCLNSRQEVHTTCTAEAFDNINPKIPLLGRGPSFALSQQLFLLYANNFKLSSAISLLMNCASFQSNLGTLVSWYPMCCSILMHFLFLHSWQIRITFDNKLRFSTYCLELTNRAEKLYGFIIRSYSDFVTI